MSNKWFDPQLLEIFEGEAIYYHAADCPSFCDFACNGMVGSLVAEAYNEADVTLRAQLAAFHPRQDHSGAGQETRDALVVVEAARKLIADWRMHPEPEDKYDAEAEAVFEACATQLAAALRTGEREG